MISILIPIYNVDVTNLVNNLLEQIHAQDLPHSSDHPYELIMLDDASPDDNIRRKNASLSENQEVTYLQNQTNRGRSATRNLLVQHAQNDLLIMMDCDASVASPTYLKQYTDFLQAHPTLPTRFVVSGGLVYRGDKPEYARRLRWKYGQKRECRLAKERNQAPYKSFTPFNILISRSTFEHNGFDESFDSYGYEDTFWGYQLQQQQIPVIHIDNPLFHDGLDTNEQFLQKTRTAIANLARLMDENRIPDQFWEESSLLRTYRYFQKRGLLPLCRLCYHMLHFPMEWWLHTFPTLRLLDAYKLFCLAKMSKLQNSGV